MQRELGASSNRVRRFLLENVERAGVAILAAEKFGLTRQAVNQHLRILQRQGLIIGSGMTRDRSYTLVNRELLAESFPITPSLQEDVVWSKDVAPVLEMLPRNVLSIWNYCFTEIFNNAIDHSEGTEISVNIEMNAINCDVVIHDDGVGIFRKIQRAMDLVDERQAVLELAKGKFTTDKTRHSGLGVFFSSRMLDSFDIMSGAIYFNHEAGRSHDWLIEDKEPSPGTTVFMKLRNDSTRTTSSVFELFSDGNSLSFNKTIVPVALAQYGNEQLVSRSQAKRVLARVEQFEYVVFDFSDVQTIGQGFADEIFRVFANAHPKVKLTAVKESPEVRGMIRAVQKEALSEMKADRRKLPMAKRRK